MESSCRRTVPVILIILAFIFSVGAAFGQSPASSSQRQRQMAQELTRKGLQALHEKRTGEARRLLEQALKVDPNYDQAHAAMAEWYFTYLQKDQAIDSYKKAININGNEPKYHIQLGKIYLESSDHKNALSYFRRAKDLKPDDPHVYFYLGDTFKKMGDISTAKENLEALLQILENDNKWKENKELGRIYWSAKFQLGNIAVENKEYKVAQKHYDDIIAGNNVDETINSSVRPALEIVKQKNNQTVMLILLGVCVFILIMMLVAWRVFIMPHRASSPSSQLPSSALDAKNYPELAYFAVQHLRVLTQMPRALVYFARREEDPLMLALADNLDRERFEELQMNWDEVPTWIESIQCQPFVFEKQKKEIPFLRSFPRGRDKLDPASPRIGIPFIFDYTLRGIAFMCYPNLGKKEKNKLKNLYVKNIPQIRKLSEDVGRAADKLYRKEISIADTITPAYNQIYFKEKLQEDVAYSRATEGNLALMMLECEGMEAILNRFGEDRKNYVLKTVVQAILVKLGTDNAAIFRVGDYRFAILHPDLGVIQAKETATQLLELIAQQEFTTPIPRIHANLGLAVYPDHSDDDQGLERAAVAALDRARTSPGHSNLVVGTEVSSVSISRPLAPMDATIPITAAAAGAVAAETADDYNGDGSGKHANVMIAPVEIRPDASPIEKLRLAQKQPISIAPPPDDEPVVSPSGSLIRPRGSQKSPISIAPPPADTEDRGERRKPSSPFTFRSAPKSPPSAFGGVESAPTRTFSPSEAPPPVISSFDDLWGGPDQSKSTGPATHLRGNASQGESGEGLRSGGGDSRFGDRKSRGLLPKAEGNRDTSLIRRASTTRNVGSATSKLPPLPKTTDSRKPMSNLLRRTSASGEPSGDQNLPPADSGRFRAPNQEPAGQKMPSQMGTPGRETGHDELIRQGVDPDKIINQKTVQLVKPESDPLAPKKMKFDFRQSMPVTNADGKPAGVTPAPHAPRTPKRPPIGTAPLPRAGTAPLKPLAPPASPQSIRGKAQPTSGAAPSQQGAAQQQQQQQQPAAQQRKRVIPPGMEDPVTGFFLKPYFEQSIGRLMVRANQTRRPLCILFFKLDRHKDLKGRYGQDKLDNALREISSMIRSFLKEGSDVPARYSDEIFVIILPDTTFQMAFNLAEQIRFTSGNYSFRDIPGQITLSLGVASFPDKGRSPKELMKNSYDALVYAIKTGGNRSVIWDAKYFKK